MLGSFTDTFKNKKTDIPQEVVELIKKELPSNFTFEKDKNGNYITLPNPEAVSAGQAIKSVFNLDFDKEDADFCKALSMLPPEKLPEYLYRTQRSVHIKNLKIGDEEKLIPDTMLMGNPLVSDNTEYERIIKPNPLLEAVKFTFESVEGDKVEIRIQQQVYDSLVEERYTSIDFPALTIEMYMYNPLIPDVNTENSKTNADEPIRFICNVKPEKADTVQDAVKVLHVFRDLLNGHIKINGNLLSPEKGDIKPDSEKVDETILFWETLLRLETILAVHFKPDADFDYDSSQFYAELKTCLIENKDIIWNHPFNHFRLGGFRPTKDDISMENLIGKDNIVYRFVSGPEEHTLLGSSFEIYSNMEMKDFVITNIVWDDEKKESGVVYITDKPDRTWTLKQKYMTKEQVKALGEE